MTGDSLLPLRTTIATIMCGALLVGSGPVNAQPGLAPRLAEGHIIAAIEERGGSVTRDKQVADEPVPEISFHEAITDADLELVGWFPRLRSLRITKGNITDEGLASLSGLACLEDLHLQDVRITD